MRRRIPIGIQDFAKLREKSMAYVDKTAYVWEIAQSGVPMFLSRPRRFGKSLLVSTLKAYWEGRSELFEGLEIFALESAREGAWTPHPVFHLDLDGADYSAAGALEVKLEETLCDWEEIWGDTYNKRSLSGRFAKLLEVAHNVSGRRAVVLVDEYDKPLLDTLSDSALTDRNRGVLKGFYGVLKEADEHLESVFVCGVTRFSSVSIFSDMNNLMEISLVGDYCSVCGVTEAEIRRYLSPEVERLARRRNESFDDALERLRDRYDGYCFHPGGPDAEDAENVYNPFSLMCALQLAELGSWWYGTGTPTLLVRRMREAAVDARKLVEGGVHAEKAYLMNYRAENPDPVPLLFQAGYLTIRGYDDRYDEYSLGIPNLEVKDGLLSGLLSEYTGGASTLDGTRVGDLRRCLEEGDTDGVHDILSALFASIPYASGKVCQDPFEHYFQAILCVTFLLLGIYVSVETHVAHGRVDVTVECRHHVYVMELKRDGSASEALAQIEDRGYAQRYAGDPRRLHRVGCSFDSSTRLLADWAVE